MPTRANSLLHFADVTVRDEPVGLASRVEEQQPPVSPGESYNNPQPPPGGQPVLVIPIEQPPPTPTPEPALAEHPDCDNSASPLYCVYEVREGDNLTKISDKFGYSSYEYLLHSNKPDIASENAVLEVGQKIRIPKGRDNVLYAVLTNDTLGNVAQSYGVPVEAIVAIPENRLSDRDTLTIGKELLIPSPTRFAAATPVPAPTARPAPTAASTPTVSRGFVWPATGPISSYFGPSHPLGIDIDLYQNPTSSIVAAKSGVVTFAGGNACCSYGYYVIVDHGDGYETLYAHFSSILVNTGQRVSQGQALGIAGRTGYATGVHLHFEVRLNGSLINPLSVLP